MQERDAVETYGGGSTRMEEGECEEGFMGVMMEQSP